MKSKRKRSYLGGGGRSQTQFILNLLITQEQQAKCDEANYHSIDGAVDHVD